MSNDLLDSATRTATHDWKYLGSGADEDMNTEQHWGCRRCAAWTFSDTIDGPKVPTASRCSAVPPVGGRDD